MKPMSCDQVQKSLIDYIELEFINDERKQVKAHLNECNQCRGSHDGLVSMLSDARKIPVQDPGQGYWDSLPGNVLREVRLKKALKGDANVVNLAKVIDARNDVSKHVEVAKKGLARPPRENWLKVALSVAASILVVVGVTLFMPSHEVPIDSVRFQASITSNKSLASLVKQFSPIDDSSARYGFSEQRKSTNAFFIGTIYSETLAFLKSGDIQSGEQHLDYIYKALSGDQMATGLSEQILLLKKDAAHTDVIDKTINALVSFQLAYEQYIKQLQPTDLIYFRAGAWSVDVALAALANDKVSIKKDEGLGYLLTEMRRIKAPKGVTRALEEMSAIANKASLTDRDVKSYYRFTQKLRGLLI